MRVRVATINMMAPAGPFLPWGKRAQQLAQLLSQKSLDLVATQEATEESLEEFRERFPGHSVHGRGRWADGSGIQCAMLYHKDRFKLNDAGHFWFSRNPAKPGSKLAGMGSPRVASWVILESEVRKFTWLNVHFSHLSRRPQARLVLERLARLPRPWLLTGDFNATPWPPWSSHRILTRQLRDLAPTGPTWNAGLGLPLARLDWVMGSREWRPLSNEVWRVGTSDHWPVLADLALSREAL